MTHTTATQEVHTNNGSIKGIEWIKLKAKGAKKMGIKLKTKEGTVSSNNMDTAGTSDANRETLPPTEREASWEVARFKLFKYRAFESFFCIFPAKTPPQIRVPAAARRKTKLAKVENAMDSKGNWDPPRGSSSKNFFWK
jgi:hypothetical protein